MDLVKALGELGTTMRGGVAIGATFGATGPGALGGTALFGTT